MTRIVIVIGVAIAAADDIVVAIVAAAVIDVMLNAIGPKWSKQPLDAVVEIYLTEISKMKNEASRSLMTGSSAGHDPYEAPRKFVLIRTFLVQIFGGRV